MTARQASTLNLRGGVILRAPSRRRVLRPSLSSPLVDAARLHRREAGHAEVCEFAYELEAVGGLEVHGEDVEVCVAELAQLVAEGFGREVAGRIGEPRERVGERCLDE